MERHMLSRTHGVPWIEDVVEDSSSWTRTNNESDSKDQDIALEGGPLTSFKSMLEGEWYMDSYSINPSHHQQQHHQDLTLHQETFKDVNFCSNPNDNNNFMLHPIDTSSCSPPFLQPKSCFPSLFNPICNNNNNNPFDNSGFDLGPESQFLGQFQGHNSQTQNSHVLMGFSGMNSQPNMSNIDLLPASDNGVSFGGGFSPMGLEGYDNNAMFSNKAKVLRPLDVFPQVGAQPTLFQKRAALRQISGGVDKLGGLDVSPSGFSDYSSLERKRKLEEGENEEASFDASGLNYDSDDVIENSKVEEDGNNGGSNSIANSTAIGGDQKGKKKGLPAKNLMAERRRRKKLNDRLYMLRSVVPKISKMDRASILGDAIDYLKELLQRINDLHNELESTPPGSLPPPSTNVHPLTPTLPTLPCRVKEELCPTSLPSPKNQPSRVEVRLREGRAVNIHMFCARRPGLLLTTLKTLDNLGLDIQQAVISCFNGFALDVFRAEQCREGQDVPPEQIRAVLLESAGCHGMV